MPVIDESIVIDRGRSEMFAFATDPVNVPPFNSYVISIEGADGGPGRHRHPEP